MLLPLRGISMTGAFFYRVSGRSSADLRLWGPRFFRRTGKGPQTALRRSALCGHH